MRGFRFFLFSFIFLFLTCGSIIGSALVEELTAPKVRILLGLDGATRSKAAEHLKSELNMLEKQWEDSDIYDQKRLEILRQIEELKEVSHKKYTGSVVKQVSALTALGTILKEIKECKFSILSTLRQHIDFWEKHFSDTVHQANIVEEKSLYSFLDMQNIMKKIYLQEEQIQVFLLKKDEKSIEISKQEHLHAKKDKELDSIEQAIEDKKKQLNFSKDEIMVLDLEKDVVSRQRELASLLLSLYQKQQEFLNAKELVAQERLQVYKDEAEVVRGRLYIDISDVRSYQQKNIDQKKILSDKKNELIKLRGEIVERKILAQEELDRLRKRYKISFSKLRQLEDMEVTVNNISESFVFYTIARAYLLVATYERWLYKIKTEIDLLDAKSQQVHIVAETVKLLYEISQGSIKNTETFEKERIAYKASKQALMASVALSKDELAGINVVTKDGQRILSHLQKQLATIQEISEGLSSSQQKKALDCSMLLNEMIQDMQAQHELLTQKGEFFGQIIVAQEETLESIDCILREFDMIGVWHRSISAVTWDGVLKIWPNLKLFVADAYTVVSDSLQQVTMRKMAFAISRLSFGSMLIIFLTICLVFFIFLFLQVALPLLYAGLMASRAGSETYLYIIRQALAIVTGLFIQVFRPLYIWILFYLITLMQGLPVAFSIIFFIYSLFFGIYASRKLLAQFIYVNHKFDYYLVAKRLIDKFSLIFSFFSISTVLILSFRKVFMVVMAHQPSEFPNILLRIYHIVIFISIVFSLDKEELLQALPKKFSFGGNLASVLERYYYAFLLSFFSLLIMSDPYLGGYGTLMWHVFWNLFVTIFIISFLFLLHLIIKQYSVVLFFQPDESISGSSERFDYAKTWYAIFVLCLIFLFSLVAIVLCAQVWGYGFTYGTLRKIVMYELFKIESINSTGKVIPESFKFINLLYIIFVSCLGVFLAYLFRVFILKRIFDIQYVDPGIQNTVNIISRYAIIIAAIMIACIQSKLGYIVTYVSFVGIATFGWSFKDLFTDFVAYFFILVQRPVKLGDYVRIDDYTKGVVRQISSRAVILRYKNSVTIVVPNSTVLKASLYNWNYARGYIGLEDIIFSVPFGTPITRVREVCFKVLEEDSDILKVPQALVRLDKFGDKGYVFMVRGFVSSGNTLRQWDIASNVRFALVERLAKEGIVIAGPSMKVVLEKELIDTSINQI